MGGVGNSNNNQAYKHDLRRRENYSKQTKTKLIYMNSNQLVTFWTTARVKASKFAADISTINSLAFIACCLVFLETEWPYKTLINRFIQAKWRYSC